ncbi:MAG: ComF family protein [Clostridiales bacterium]|nr:ComF family protein [Clostridiales bacterium]
MQTIAEGLKGLLFPRARCLSCNEPRKIDLGDSLCDECIIELDKLKLVDYLCAHCLSPKHHADACAYCAQGGMVGLAAAYSPYRYHSVSQRLIVRLKFDGIYQAAEPLIEGMLSSFPGRPIDLMVPVPLHKSNYKKRGFNQSELLCRLLSAQTGLPYQNALSKTIKTKRQSTLSHEKRQDNIKGAFAAEMSVDKLRILLVDDVRTSGSTARACAQALLKAGAKEVSLLTATVAGTTPESPPVQSYWPDGRRP